MSKKTTNLSRGKKINRIREEDDKFRTLVEQSPVSIQIMDAEGFTLRVNKAWEKLWGVKMKDLKGYNMLKDKQLVKLGIMKYIKKAFDGKISSIPAAEYDTVDTLGKGYKKWVQARIYPVKDKKGKIQQVVLMHEDITKQKIAEKKLKEYKNKLEIIVKEKTSQLKKSEEEYRALAEYSPDCIKLFDIKGNILYMNPGGLKEHGFKNMEEALKKNWRAIDAIVPEDRPKFNKAIKDAAKGKVSSIEIRHPRGKSIREACSEVVAPIKDEKGRVTGIFGVSRDLTDHRKAEKVLKESEEKFRVLTESSQDCIKLFDLKGNLKYINKGGLKEHGLKSVKEALDKKWQAIETVVKDDRPKFREALKAAAKGRVSTIEIRHTEKGADRDVCSELIAPIRNEKGNITGVFGVSRDISEIKKVEKELRDIKENLEKKVAEQTEDLRGKVEKLERINKLMVGRELKMIELKKEIKNLKQ